MHVLETLARWLAGSQARWREKFHERWPELTPRSIPFHRDSNDGDPHPVYLDELAYGATTNDWGGSDTPCILSFAVSRRLHCVPLLLGDLIATGDLDPTLTW
eukprot:INCI9336.3.p4 GENE.INCI9336.3~~INCI9336.3.p4  ORF type:complete len:102 (+),score=14.11 INCI9336.3:94-399(+)